MSAPMRVPLQPGSPNFADIRNGSPIKASTWLAGAHSAAFALGRGMQLVPWFSPDVLITDGSTEDFYFRVRPRYQATRRRISVLAYGPDTSGTITVDTPNLPAPVVLAYQATQWQARPIHIIEPLGAQSGDEAEIRVTIEATEGDVIINGIGIVELPRHTLSLDTNEYGLDLTTLVTGEAIFADDATSVRGLVDSSPKALDVARRHLINWARPVNQPSIFSTGGYVDLWPLGIPVLGRKIYRADTTATVKCRVRAKVSAGGTTGSVRVSLTSSGNTDVIATGGLTSTTAAWYPSTAGDATSLTIDCEDLSTNDGRPAGASDYLKVAVKRDAGVGEIHLQSVSVWEEAPL